MEQKILFTLVSVIFIHSLFERKFLSRSVDNFFFLHTLDIQYPIAWRGCHTVCHLFKKLKLFSHQLNEAVSLFKTIFLQRMASMNTDLKLTLKSWVNL